MLLLVVLLAVSTVFATTFETQAHRAALDELRWKIIARDPSAVFDFFDSDDEDDFSDVNCDVCKLFVGLLQQWGEEEKTQDEITELATKVCKDLHLYTDRICDIIFWLFKGEIAGIVENLVLSPNEVCGIVVGPSCADPYNPELMWNITLPNTPKPPVKPPEPPQPSAPKLRFLQLSDLHIDLMYETGANAECGEPLCCRSNDGPPKPGVPGAGRWGDRRFCDVSMHLVYALFKHLQSIQNQFDFIIFTGDIPAHDVWNQTRSKQIGASRNLAKLFHQYLPQKPVFFCAGNHESSPINSFPPPEVTGNNSISWLYTVFAETWSTWLPPDTKQTILKGAYYSMSPYPGFRIVSINSNYCNRENWWLLVNRTDPADQLQWLVHVLQEAEDAKEKVFILSHIPPGKNNCLKPWSWNFYKIVNRYESTITAQFYGHTHKDQFEVFYDDVTFKRPTSIAYIVGSVTTLKGLNPGYRIYTMDGNYTNSSWAVLDSETYYVDLKEANNVTKPPAWKLEYSQKTEYNMTGLYPQDWSDLIYRMKQDDMLFQKFNKFYYTLGHNKTITSKLKRKRLCMLKTARSHDPNLCSDL